MKQNVWFILGIWLSALGMSIMAGMIARYGWVDTPVDSSMSNLAHTVWWMDSGLLSVGGFLTTFNWRSE